MTDFNYTKNLYNQYADFYIKKRLDPKQSYYNNYLSNYQLIQQLKEIIPAKTVLDIGCGQGTFTKELHKLGAHVQGIDLSEELIAYAQKTIVGIEFSVANAQHTNFSNNTFDIVVSNLMAHYFKDLSPLFEEVLRILKPNGMFVFSMHHPFNEVLKEERINDELKMVMQPYFHNEKYLWYMDDMELISYHHTFTDISQQLKKNGFYIDEIEESQPLPSSKSSNQEVYNLSSHYPTFCIIKAVKK